LQHHSTVSTPTSRYDEYGATVTLLFACSSSRLLLVSVCLGPGVTYVYYPCLSHMHVDLPVHVSTPGPPDIAPTRGVALLFGDWSCSCLHPSTSMRRNHLCLGNDNLRNKPRVGSPSCQTPTKAALGAASTENKETQLLFSTSSGVHGLGVMWIQDPRDGHVSVSPDGKQPSSVAGAKL
jgi:hypothetical protein